MYVVFALSLLVSPAAHAQDGGHVHEDRAEVRSDTGDLARLRDDIRDWKAAVDSKSRAAEKAADLHLAIWIRNEAIETTAEVREDRAELGQARAEARGPGPGDAMDRRDDRADLGRERGDRSRMQAIAVELKALQPHFDNESATPAHYVSKRALLDELETLAQREIARGQGEVREDVRENHEIRKR